MEIAASLAFLAKKSLSFFLKPVGMAIGLWLLAILLWRYRAASRWLLLLSGLVIAVCSNAWVSGQLAGTLERQALHFDMQAHSPQYILLLGARSDPGIGVRPTHALSAIALARLEHALWLLQQYPDAQLLTSSGSFFVGQQPFAEAARNAAIDMGADPQRIHALVQGMDTIDEAEQLYNWLPDRSAPVALVTSATHMPRTMQIFRAAGVQALPAPTDFLSRDAVFHLGFNAYSLATSQRAIHEYLGLWWWQLRLQWRSWVSE